MEQLVIPGMENEAVIAVEGVVISLCDERLKREEAQRLLEEMFDDDPEAA